MFGLFKKKWDDAIKLFHIYLIQRCHKQCAKTTISFEVKNVQDAYCCIFSTIQLQNEFFSNFCSLMHCKWPRIGKNFILKLNRWKNTAVLRSKGVAGHNAQGCAFVHPIFGPWVKKWRICTSKIMASVINYATNIE